MDETLFIASGSGILSKAQTAERFNSELRDSFKSETKGPIASDWGLSLRAWTELRTKLESRECRQFRRCRA